MKFGCTLEMVNLRISGPNSLQMLSRSYWRQMFKLVAAAGFKTIELPYNPFTTEPIAFEIGRSGAPINTYAVDTMYGSVPEFKKLLQSFGIDEVASVHIKAGDALMELVSAQKDVFLLIETLDDMMDQAIDFLSQIGGKYLVISPSPEFGMIKKYMVREGDVKKAFDSLYDKLVIALNKKADAAAAKGVTMAVNNDFWGLVHGNRIDDFLGKLDSRIKYSPDLAHMYIAKMDIDATLRKYADRLACVRFSDTEFEDKEEVFLELNAETPQKGAQKVFSDMGDGKVDLVGAYKTLKEIGYDDIVVCDSKRTLDVYRALLKMRSYVNLSIEGA